MIAGLEPITAGEIAIGDRIVNNVAPKDRDIAMVFQSYALYPTMTVRQNITFGMESRGVPKAVQNAAVERVSNLLHIEMLLHRKPSQLSGGQRQRVAMGGRWCATRCFSSSTSRSPISTPSFASRCERRSRSSTSASTRLPST
jgi:multiple sugar transport system ATP-binding protein